MSGHLYSGHALKGAVHRYCLKALTHNLTACFITKVTKCYDHTHQNGG